MATKAQVEANRRNSKKSTGPKSRDGKHRVSQNAVSHGIFSQATILPGEDPEQHDWLRVALRSHYNPVTVYENLLFDRIVAISRRLLRATKAEAAAFLPVQMPEPRPEMVPLDPDPLAVSEHTRAATEALNPGAIDLYTAMGVRGDELDRIMRYEAQMLKELNKLNLEYECVQFARIHGLHPYHVRNMRRFAPVSEPNPENDKTTADLENKANLSPSEEQEYTDKEDAVQRTDLSGTENVSE